NGISAITSSTKRWRGMRSVAGALPVALTPPAPGIGPFGNPYAPERSPIDRWKPDGAGVGFFANCSGMKTCPLRITQEPLIWNLRAAASWFGASKRQRPAMSAIRLARDATGGPPAPVSARAEAVHTTKTAQLQPRPPGASLVQGRYGLNVEV